MTVVPARSGHALLPVSRRRALVLAAAALALLAVAGRTLGGAGAAAEQPAAPLVREHASAAPRLTVHVAGAVRQPGLYRLPGPATRRRRGRPCGRSDRVGRHGRHQPRRPARGRDAGAQPRRVPGRPERRRAAASASARRLPRSWTRCRASVPSRPRRSSTTAPSTAAFARSTTSTRFRESARPDRAASGRGLALIARTWPTLLVLATCVGLALANAIRAPATLAAAALADSAVSLRAFRAYARPRVRSRLPWSAGGGEHAARRPRAQRARAGDRPLGSGHGRRHRAGRASTFALRIPAEVRRFR